MQKQENGESELLLVCDTFDSHKSVQVAMDEAFDNGYGLISYPLIDPKNDSSQLVYKDNFLSNIPFVYHSDSTSSIFQSVYGKCSPWITFNPYHTYCTQQNIKLLQHELDWSLHLGIYSVILPNPQIAYPLDKSNVMNTHHNHNHNHKHKHTSSKNNNNKHNNNSNKNNSNMNSTGAYLISGIHNNNETEKKIEFTQDTKINHTSENNNKNKNNNYDYNNHQIVEDPDQKTESYFEIAMIYASAMIQLFKSRVHVVGIIPITFDDDGWQLWQPLSILLRDVKNVRPALIVGKNAPSKQLVQQWFAEGVQIFIISHDVFLTNKKGFPVLSRAHQKVLLKFLRRCDTTIIVKGRAKTKTTTDDANGHGSTHSSHGASKRHCQYLKHLRLAAPSLDPSEYDAKPFWDILQTPLQPLSNNLEYSTYETFESDPIKYSQYEKAIIQCLIDLDKKQPPPPPQSQSQKNNPTEFIVMVLGAGRGPLVTAALNASKSTNIGIKLYAIEKNPHAVIILKDKNTRIWNKRVTIIATDMRTWQQEKNNKSHNKKAHIIISELLGSFGDNELSPECLDGAQRLLRCDGVSIPCKYTSYLCPMTNNSVYSKLTDKPRDFETPYVVHLMRHSLLSREIKKCWSFVHPNHSVKHQKSNSKYCKLTFKCNHNIPHGKTGAIVHGFAGYFDTVLYNDVKLSIHPKNASQGMFSWFPMFFPLMDPIRVQMNDIVNVHFWRKIDQRCVWYEWCVTKPILSQIHNPNHRTYCVNLQ